MSVELPSLALMSGSAATAGSRGSMCAEHNQENISEKYLERVQVKNNQFNSYTLLHGHKQVLIIHIQDFLRIRERRKRN